MSFLKLNNKTIVSFGILLLLLVPVLLPLFRSGFFLSDDGEWMIIRFSAFYEALRDGQFPVRLLQRLNQGYGYPVANFLYPGFMYLGVPIHVIGFSFTDTIKILFGLSVVGSALFTYLWLRRIFSTFPSVIGSLFYVYAPYYLYDIYKRGSLGEILALTIIPFIFWSIERKSLFWSAIGIGVLLLAHNTLAVFFLGLVVFYLIVRTIQSKGRKKFIIRSMSSCLIGIGLASFFWIPALYELQFTRFSETVVSNYADYFSSISLVGITTYLIFTVTLFCLFRKKIPPENRPLTILFLLVGLLSTFLATSGSILLWQVLPVSFVQFPFRFLSVAVVAGSFLSGVVFSVISGKGRIVLLIIVSLVTVVSSWQVLRNVETTVRPDEYYATNLDTTTVRQEYMPVWVKKVPTEWQSKKVLTENGTIADIKTTSNTITFITDAKQAASYAVQKTYYPGWSVRIDGNPTEIAYGNPSGIIMVSVPNGRHEVVVSFAETPLRVVSNLLSVFSLLALVLIVIFRHRQSKL